MDANAQTANAISAGPFFEPVSAKPLDPDIDDCWYECPDDTVPNDE